MKKTFYFQWHFIESCNLRCTHCYQNGYENGKMTHDQLLATASRLDEALDRWQRRGRVALTGGEPFLQTGLLFDLLNFFDQSENFYWVAILTNGTLIDKPIVEEMTRFKKLKDIQVSIDGSVTDIHNAIRGQGSFEKTIEAVRLLKKKELSVSVMFTLHKQNVHDVIHVVDMAEKLGVDFLTVERLVPQDEKDIREFLLEPHELKKVYHALWQKKSEVESRGKTRIRMSRPLWCLIDSEVGGFCPAGFSSLAILHDGTLLPCRRLEIPLGNILEDGLFKTWYTSEVLWKLRNKSLLSGKCRDCFYLGRCGGCRAIAYKLNGDFMAQDPQCWLEEKYN